MTFRDDLERVARRHLVSAINVVGQTVAGETARDAPFGQTGQLKRSVQASRPRASGRDGYVVTVTAGEGLRDGPGDRNRADYTEHGTGVYAGRGRIRPRRASALRFYWLRGPRGPGVYAYRSVRGQPPQEWFAKPMRQRLRRAARAVLTGRIR